MSHPIIQSLSANVAIALICSALVQPAMAGEAADRPSRADVEAETLAAVRSHSLTPAGEGEVPRSHISFRSTTTRRQVDAETLQAVREGRLTPAGEAADWQASRSSATSSSMRTRSEVVAETRAAVRAHKLTPAGEGWDATEYR